MSSTVAGNFPESTIIFNSVGRSRYAFDIFTVDLHSPASEIRLTDGISVNYNGYFPSNKGAEIPLVYVSERNGSFGIYLTSSDEKTEPVGLETDPVVLKDRPVLTEEFLIYVSTEDDPGEARQSWAAVYSKNLQTGEKLRLTPPGTADFSPAVSPSGRWTAVASLGDRGWTGEIAELRTGIFVFETGDGSDRTMVAEHGGWPSWADDNTLYFHRQSDDGWWSVYKVNLSSDKFTVGECRITPPGIHAFTPASVLGSDLVAVATRRPHSEHRQIELYDITHESFIEITEKVSPNYHHYNPFVSLDGNRLGYHRCRGEDSEIPWLESRHSPVPEISLFRIDGSFPAFSPDGNQIAYASLPGLFVANRDGSHARKILAGVVFGIVWSDNGVIYASQGPIFAGEQAEVDVVAIQLVPNGYATVKKLTSGGGNNAFPSPSPDGLNVVFRSGRTGFKNLYIMDGEEGEVDGLVRLTEGEWTDTMCNWSPDGKWIAFSSDRDQPGSGSFAVYLIQPDGSDLRKILETGGRVNHPWFSPDSKWLVFTADFAAVSAEPIGIPHQFQPYGEIFISEIDGSNVLRLTHDGYEDGTPMWAPVGLVPADVSGGHQRAACRFDDCHFLAQKGNSKGDEAYLES